MSWMAPRFWPAIFPSICLPMHSEQLRDVERPGLRYGHAGCRCIFSPSKTRSCVRGRHQLWTSDWLIPCPACVQLTLGTRKTCAAPAPPPAAPSAEAPAAAAAAAILTGPGARALNALPAAAPAASKVLSCPPVAACSDQQCPEALQSHRTTVGHASLSPESGRRNSQLSWHECRMMSQFGNRRLEVAPEPKLSSPQVLDLRAQRLVD